MKVQEEIYLLKAQFGDVFLGAFVCLRSKRAYEKNSKAANYILTFFFLRDLAIFVWIFLVLLKKLD